MGTGWGHIRPPRSLEVIRAIGTLLSKLQLTVLKWSYIKQIINHIMNYFSNLNMKEYEKASTKWLKNRKKSENGVKSDQK